MTLFPAVDPETWRARAEGDDARELVTRVDGGLEVAWLYTFDDEIGPDPGGAPGSAPFTRGARIGEPWDIRQEQTHPDRRAANAGILADLEGGATSITLRFAGESDGVAIATLDQLDEVLDGVFLDLAPVALDAGAAAVPAAALLVALWERRGHDLGAIEGSFRCDPLGVLAATGALAQQPAEAVAGAGAFAAESAELVPKVRPLAVDTGAYAEAGATAPTEVAVAAATGASYLRAAAGAGLSPSDAAPRIEFTLTAGPDQFLEIAKYRAMRRVWARVLEVSDVPPDQRRSPLYARTSRRALAAVDPWVNMLRGTTAAFSAAVAGADGITVLPFDAVLDPDIPPGALGRRIARNTQIVLHDESSLARVADPAGGSWYVESLTDQLAQAAWRELQAIESAGGIASVLFDGSLAERLREEAAARAGRVARRERTLTGVNTFPLLGDDGVTREERSAGRSVEASEGPGLGSGTLRELATAAARGAHLVEPAAAARLPAGPLARSRESEPFEDLRARAAAASPHVFLACLGPLAAHVNVATWAKSFFETGGIATVPSGAHESVDALAGAFAADGAKVAVLCAGKKTEPDTLDAAAQALRAAGAEEVLIAGSDEVRDGVDMIALLGDLLDRMGVPK